MSGGPGPLLGMQSGWVGEGTQLAHTKRKRTGSSHPAKAKTSSLDSDDPKLAKHTYIFLLHSFISSASGFHHQTSRNRH